MPKCIGYKEQKQEVHDVVPGEYTIFLLSEKLPGVRLSEELFWSFGGEERETICEAFKTAYEYVSGIPFYFIN